MSEFVAIVVAKYPNDAEWTARYLPLANITASGDTPEEAIVALREELCEREYNCIDWVNRSSFVDNNI